MRPVRRQLAFTAPLTHTPLRSGPAAPAPKAFAPVESASEFLVLQANMVERWERDCVPQEDRAEFTRRRLRAYSRRLKEFLVYTEPGDRVLDVGAGFVDPDLWGHVKYGQEVIADGCLPETATHTYTAEGFRWINHENLSEIAVALVYEHLGVYGLTLGKCVLGMAILSLMLLTARRQAVDSAAPPLGVHHHYARLGFVTFPASQTDCRRLWPPVASGESSFRSGDTR